ncbi:MAG TPA: tandem-95 repeat protein [Dongiaceae bacterium]|nr:tandem-95 repeat protein [Dongiaceae bacterium]
MATNTSQGTANNTTGTKPADAAAAAVLNGQQGGQGAAVQVQFNNGQNVARVQAAPGETVTLPFDGDFQAKIGEQGNLAIKLGDRIVILQGYTEANQQESVTVKDDKGHTIDVASVIAATDPNLDIQTAAGPAAGPAGATGSGIFLSFNNGGGLGGLGEMGLIGATELQYQQIAPDEANLVRGDALASLTVPVLGSAGTEVDEAGLPQGSAHGNNSNITSGVIAVTAPDGVASVTVNGVVVTASELGNLSANPITIPTADGNLTLTGWNGAQLSYTYTLTHNTSGDTTTDSVSVVVTDTDGDQGSGTLVIGIHDDVPTAQNDSLSIAPGDYSGHQGNVVTAAGEDSAADADVKGADGATVTHITGANGNSDVSSSGATTILGEYGVLTIAADGSYTYTRSAGTAGGVDDSFTYTLTDGDGDTTSATLTVHIDDATPTVTIGNCGGDTVYEAGLPNGSAAWSLAKYTAGSFTYSQGDGPASVTINGVAVVAGAQIHGQDGTLTILAVKNGVVTYVYELTHNTQGDHTQDDFSIVVTDKDGDSANGSLAIHIVDDMPAARNDVDYVTAGSHQAESGNVITGAGTATWILGADTKGADGASVTHVSGYGGSAAAVAASGDTVINGHYGVLTIHADGSYSYQRNAGTPGGVDDVFTYTLTDGDGDSSSASLTIKIGDAHPDAHVPNEGGSGAKVFEAGLADGSHHGNGSNVTSGAITYTQGDGPATVTIGGVAVTGVGQTISGQFGTLTITSVGNGTIGYSYTLADNSSGDHTHDTFSVVVTDVDGDKSSANLTIDIVDDTPTAHNDSGEVATGTYSVAGSVITNDTKGADGATVSKITGAGGADSSFDPHGHLVIAGQYGTLTISADGSYTYDRAPGSKGGVTDTFTYVLKDGDGDTSSATLTINIDDAKPTLHVPDAHDAGTAVDEAGLASGSHRGDGSNVTSGVMTYSEGDGPAAITINNQTVHAGDTVTTAAGTLHIDAIANGEIHYTYTLTHNTSGDATTDTFNVVVQDKDSDKASATLTIGIVDDRPTAVVDTGSTGSGGTITKDAASGIEANDTFGADGRSGGGVVGVSHGATTGAIGDPTGIHGDYGTLYLNSDGSYVYKANADVGGDDVFTYTIKDGDGDTTTATLTIHVDKVTPGTLVSSIIVDEANQPTVGSNHVTQPNAVTGYLDLGGASIQAGIYFTAHGILDLNASGKYTYTLFAPYNDGKADDTAGISTGDVFTVQTSDGHGNHGTAVITINIKDDVPHAVLDTGEIGSGATLKADAAHGVSSNDGTGADWAGAAVTGVSHNGTSGAIGDPAGIRGDHGTLYLNADGSYTYKADADASGDDVFTYMMKDGDGDASSTTLTIHVDQVTPPTITGAVTVDEANLPAGGSNHHATPDTVTGDLALNGLAISAGTYATAHGVLTIDAAGHYSYTLTSPYNDGKADSQAGTATGDTFTLPTTDANGNHGTATVTITVKDDVPQAVLDTAEIGAGKTLTVDAIHGVSGNDTAGADGATISGVSHGAASATIGDPAGIRGDHGTLYLNADGSYTYKADANASGDDVFTYSLKDGDGDISIATLTVHIDAIPTLHVPGTGDAGTSVNEAGLTSGSHAGNGSNVTTGTFTYTEGDGPATITVNNQVIHVGDTVTTATGSLHVDSIGNGTVGYTYTLTHNTSGDSTADAFNVVVQDKDGDQATGTLTIGIVDDVPLAASGNATVDEDAIAAGHLGSPGIEGGSGDIGVVANTAHLSLTNLTFGADGGHVSFDTAAQPANLTSDGLTVQYRTESATVNGHAVQTLVGYIEYHSADNNSTTDVSIFTLTVDPTAKTADFTLLQPLDHPNATTEDNLDLGLKYTVTDGDGDKAVGTITVTVNDDSPTAGTVSSPAVTEPGIAGATGAASYEVDAGNYGNNAHIAVSAGFIDGNGNLLTINGDTPSINTNGAADGTTGLGVTSGTDGSGAARFDEVNYLGNGSQNYYSETMIFSLKDTDKVATTATVNLSEFYSNEGGVGDEKGAYILYKDGVAVSGWVEFEASSTSGKMALTITGPAGGFDEIRFVAVQGSANPNGNAGSDSSDFSVHDVTFNVVDTPHVSSVTGSLPAAFGADGPGSVALADGPTGLTYNGIAIVNTLVNGILVGKAGDTVVYSLALSSDGHGGYGYEFDLAKPIDGTQNGHPLAFNYNVTDNDGDTAHGTINVNVTDAVAASLGGDVILTNSLDGGFNVSDFALLRNDSGAGLSVTGVSIKGSDSGTASHSGTTGTTYQFSGGANDFTGSGTQNESNGNADKWGDNQNNATAIARSYFAQSGTALDTGTLQLTGAINSATDNDVFKLHLQAGEVLYGSILGAGGQKANVDVEIYDAHGNLVAQSGYQTATHGWGYYNVPSDGDYYIVIDGQSGNGNATSGGQGNYELDLNVLSQATTGGSFHYQAGGSETTVTVDGVSGGHYYGNDQHIVQGTGANEILVGDSHQHNYLNGGGGDDTIMYQVGDTVDGGGNSHAGQNGDLGGSYLGDVLDVSGLTGAVDVHGAVADGHIKNIDTISMTGGASESVELNIGDVLQIGNGTFHPTSDAISGLQVKDTVKVEGSAGDTLTLDHGSGNGQWVNITDHVNNAPSDHQVFAYDQNGGSFSANDVQGYVVVSNNVTVLDEHHQIIPQI